VALVTGALVLAGGGAIAIFWRGTPPITALPRVSPEGADVLALKCDPRSCENGTVVELDGARSTFVAGQSDLPLGKALHVGENTLALHIDRPGLGRDEIVKLDVPVAYRVRADVTTMGDPHPSILIRVEAVPGTEVRVDDKPVTLDAASSGAYAIDESAAVEGPADESRPVAVNVPYVVVAKGRAPEAGTVSARVAVAPLRVDAPGTRAVVEEDHLPIAGRAAKGANVTVDGASVPIGPDGAFETNVALDALGVRTVEVRSGTATLVPRIVHVVVTRVTSLREEAKTFEGQKTIGYDAAMADVGANVGQAMVVDGEVIESRASGRRTLVLMDDHRGCARGPCLARVIVGRELTLARGERLRAYGRVARAFVTSPGQTVPEVEADFVLKAKR
jgi:hypothetical protein